MLETIESELLVPKASAADAEGVVPSSSGYYAIFIADNALLPSWMLNRIDSNGILYIGIATRSLLTRLCRQELRHKSPATFFRGLGAVLGFSPPMGSLRNKKNQKNYRFSETDTAEIIQWINSNLAISWVCSDTPERSVEKKLIGMHVPPMNTANNPNSLPQLSTLRAKCREVACRES